MNRDLLDALASVTGSFYFDALERYPGLLLDASGIVDDEAVVVWRVLMVLDELAPVVQDAIEFDNERHRRGRDRVAGKEVDVDDLPF